MMKHKNNSKKRLLIRAVCLALCLLMVSGSVRLAFAGLPAFAADTAEEEDGAQLGAPPLADASARNEKTYAYNFLGLRATEAAPANSYVLSVYTGNSAGDCVTWFEVRYKTKGDDRVYSEFVDPLSAKLKALDVGYAFNRNYCEERYFRLLNTFYGTMNPPVNSKVDLNAVKKKTVLRANTCDRLYFTTPSAISELVDIRVHENYIKGGNNTWAFKEMSLYRMVVNHGLIQAGSISRDYLLAFDGELIAKTSGTGNCIVSGKNDMSVFSTAKKDKYGLVTETGDAGIYHAAQDAVIIEMDVADVAGASIFTLESGTVNTLKGIDFLETLKLEVTYKDMCGQSRTVILPFLSSCYTEMDYAMQSDVNKQKILGIFQQGDTVACSAFLPEYAEVTKCRLSYTRDPAEFDELLCHVTEKNYDSYCFDTTFGISALRFYNGEEYRLRYKYNGYSIIPEVIGTDPVPSYCWTSVSYSGTTLSLGSSPAPLPMTKYEKGVRTKAAVGSNTYLIAVTTDSAVEKAGTVDDLYISVDYMKTNGMAKTTEEYSLRELSGNFYGDWFCTIPMIAKNMLRFTMTGVPLVAGCGYYYNVSPGRTLYVTVNLSDVSSFTGATLRLKGSDEWQMSSLAIYQLASLGPRIAEWKSGSVIGRKDGASDPMHCDLDRVITRQFEGIQCVNYSNKVLMQANDKKNLSFSGGGVTEKDVEWNEYMYYMSYEDTKLDLGFTKARLTYEVTVKVGDDADGDSDCGSKNQFYFQLVFMNGKSGYVLANQQLSADGFRTGREERFTISVNRDYGDVRAIHIIPQNPNDTDETFDKLKIDYISISKMASSGINLTWRVEINDWISIDYNDSGAQDSVSGQAGKSESDIARTYVVTGTGYSTDILVAVTTGGYNDSVQFSGHVYADIRYRDSSGVDQIKSDIDVTKLMLEYAGKSADGKISVNGTECAANDKSFMLREYHTDRFVISLEDVSQLQSIQFCVFSNESGTWNITNVSMYLINGSGQRTINANQEYEIACEKSQLTTSDTDVFAVPFTNKPTYSTEIQLADNHISVTESEKSLTATVDYVPKNKDDSMNVYVYMSEDATAVDLYDMKCAVSYAVNFGTVGTDTITDKIYQKAIRLKTDKAGKMYYATGVNASGLINVCSASLQADSASRITAHVDRMVIEHVRSGVAIETFNIPFYGAAAYPLVVTGSPSGSSQKSSMYRQTVSFMLTDESMASLLGYKTDDIAVAINYTSLNGAAAHSLTSPNVFLSENDTDMVHGGSVCTVNFRQNDVKAITGIQFIAMGKLAGSVGVKNAYAANYYVDSTGKETCLGWYSFGLGLASLSASARTMSLSASSQDEYAGDMTVSAVTVGVKTAEAAQDTESGTTSPIRMTIGYYDVYGNERYAQFDDINDYAVSGSTATGDTITAKVLINNLSEVRSVEFTPYEPEYGRGDPSWSIETVTLSSCVNGAETRLARAVGSVATETEPVTVNLSTVSMSVNVFSYKASDNSSYNKVFTGTGTAYEGVLIDTAGQITFTPTVGGSTKGASCECYLISNGTPIAKNDVITVQGTSSSVRSVVFGDGVTEEGQYRIVFRSVEFPDMSLEINIIVDDPEPETTVPETTTEEQTSAETTTEEETSVGETTSENITVYG